MRAGANGLPDPALRLTFAAGAANPVDVQTGPEGDIFYADFDGGTVRRIRYFSANRPPVAVATANPTAGAAPLLVTFNGIGLERPGRGRHDLLRLGSRRGRPLRRRDRGAADADVHRRRRPTSPGCG